MRAIFLKTSILSLLGIAILVGYCSCRRQAQAMSTEPPPEPYQSTMKECSCTYDNRDSFRVELILDGKKLCFDRMRQPEAVFPDKWLQKWVNAIYIERFNSDSTLRLNVTYYNPAFLKHNLPYLIYLDSRDSCEVIGVEIFNLYPYKYCMFCPEDDSRYCTTKNVLIRILSFTDNIIEGTFEGDFTNNGGHLFKVTNGYFKTRLVQELH